MIALDTKNAMAKAVGRRHGVDEKVFSRFLGEHAPLVRAMLKSGHGGGYGFLDLPDDTELIGAINRQIWSFKKKKWSNVVVLGIGGSALGGIALQEALLGSFGNFAKTPRLFFADNIDPDWFAGLLEAIDIKKTLFLVISKSGGTTEPFALYAIAKKKLIDKKVSQWQEHFMFITDPKKGVLRQLGKAEKIAMMEVPPSVGGRFSALSCVGLLPVALAGVKVAEVLKGAKIMRKLIASAKPKENPALILASLQFLFDRTKKKPMTVMMPYSNRLFRVADWYRQLLAESIGKNETAGPTPINALGATDQHSQLQLYNEGPNNKWFIFLRVLAFDHPLAITGDLPDEFGFLRQKKLGDVLDASFQGTAESLTHHNRPNITLNLKKVDAKTVGALLMLLECQVALLGMMYQVNAFNQPGVEMSKKITKQILSEKK